MEVRKSVRIVFIQFIWDELYGRKFQAKLEGVNSMVLASEFRLPIDFYLILLSKGTVRNPKSSNNCSDLFSSKLNQI